VMIFVLNIFRTASQSAANCIVGPEWALGYREINCPSARVRARVVAIRRRGYGQGQPITSLNAIQENIQ
jgi:hypothetical protein